MSRLLSRMLLHAFLVLAGTGTAVAQVTISATPQQPSAGQDVTIAASATGDFTCEWPCIAVMSFVDVTGSNGFYTYQESWDGLASLPVPTIDAGPGQTLEPVTYTAYGGVVRLHCVIDYWETPECDITEQIPSTGEAFATVTPLAPPQNITVSPSSGSAAVQAFTVSVSHVGGYAAIEHVHLLIHTAVVGEQTCLMSYHQSSDAVNLWPDAGAAWNGVARSSGATLSNSQCALATAGMTVYGSGQTLSVTFPVTFKPSYGGDRQSFVWVVTASGVHSPWVPTGTWTVPARAITRGPVTPPSGTGSTTTLTAQFGSNYGAQDLLYGIVLVAPTLTNINACQVLVEPGGLRVGLSDDTATAIAWSPLHTGAPLENSQCRVDPAYGSVQPNGTMWTVTIPVTFKSGFAGTHHVYASAFDGDGTWHTWVETGSWTVATGPSITAVSPMWGPPGTAVTIHGERFGSGGTLELNGHQVAVAAGDWTDGTISATIPAHATAAWTGDFVVTSNGTSNGVPFEVGNEKAEYYHSDGIGSVRMITGVNGYVLERHDYLPFGEEWPPRPDEAHIGFGGKEKDQETGNGSWAALNYFGARSLHAASGRFTAVDSMLTVRSATLDPQRWNRYAYVQNNPLRYVDPDGRCSAPSGIRAGQTGICIEAFIAKSWFKGIGRGDGRGFSGKDPDLTARSRIKIIVDENGKIVFSEVESAHSGLVIKGLGLKGDTVGRATARKKKDGSVFAHVDLWGRNGEAFLAPIAPAGVLDGHFNFDISEDGDVTFLKKGSSATGFPSWGVYSYDADGNVTTLLEQREGDIGDLTKPSKPIE